MGVHKMLEKSLAKGMSASWLPRTEGGQGGTGKELSVGTKSVKDDQGIYLPFVANGINYVESNGKDVISFNFTGCIMAVYTVGGTRRVCHVSTGDGQDCKVEWASVAAAASDVKSFKPHEHIDLDPGLTFTGCYGLITADNKFFSITVTGDDKVVMCANQKAVAL